MFATVQGKAMKSGSPPSCDTLGDPLRPRGSPEVLGEALAGEAALTELLGAGATSAAAGRFLSPGPGVEPPGAALGRTAGRPVSLRPNLPSKIVPAKIRRLNNSGSPLRTLEFHPLKLRFCWSQTL